MLNHSVKSDSLRPRGLYPSRFLCPWDSSDRNTGLGCRALLQGNLADPGIEPASPVSSAMQAQDVVYNLFLKGNKIPTGTANYSEVIALLIALEGE